ncbi:MAG: dTMP kinase [Candidatus Anstonellaceae archaeon]
MLIVFEGIDGSGKGEQIKMLARFLRQHKIAYKIRKYPTKKAKEAHAHLKRKATLSPERLAKAFALDIMAQQGKIKQEIAKGLIVICDRYLQSTLAYQGIGGRYKKLKEMLLGYGALVPELVLLMDVDAKEAARRKSAQKLEDRYDQDPLFLSKVRRNYLRMAKEGFLSYKYIVLDARRPKEEVFSRVLAQVEPLLVKKMERGRREIA